MPPEAIFASAICANPVTLDRRLSEAGAALGVKTMLL
jgi:hypothetical protein